MPTIDELVQHLSAATMDGSLDWDHPHPAVVVTVVGTHAVTVILHEVTVTVRIQDAEGGAPWRIAREQTMSTAAMGGMHAALLWHAAADGALDARRARRDRMPEVAGMLDGLVAAARRPVGLGRRAAIASALGAWRRK